MFEGKFIGPRKIKKIKDETEEEPAKLNVPDDEIEGMDISAKKKKLDNKTCASNSLPKEIKSEKDLKKIVRYLLLFQTNFNYRRPFFSDKKANKNCA